MPEGEHGDGAVPARTPLVVFVELPDPA